MPVKPEKVSMETVNNNASAMYVANNPDVNTEV